MATIFSLSYLSVSKDNSFLSQLSSNVIRPVTMTKSGFLRLKRRTSSSSLFPFFPVPKVFLLSFVQFFQGHLRSLRRPSSSQGMDFIAFKGRPPEYSRSKQGWSAFVKSPQKWRIDRAFVISPRVSSHICSMRRRKICEAICKPRIDQQRFSAPLWRHLSELQGCRKINDCYILIQSEK